MSGASQPWSLDPRLASDSHPVTSFALSDLRLMDDANYPWLVLVPRAPDARELIDLNPQQQTMLMDEIGRSSRLLQRLFRPHKLNVASLGNMVPQLHVHVIARQLDDPTWPAPVWGQLEARNYPVEELVERVRQLQSLLAA